jgi:hypothetical protein
MATPVVQSLPNGNTVANGTKGVPAPLVSKKIRQVVVIIDTTAMLQTYIGTIMVSYLDPLLRYVTFLSFMRPNINTTPTDILLTNNK